MKEMEFGFLIILAVVVVVVAALLPVVCHTRQWRLFGPGLKLIGGGKPTAVANLPFLKNDYLLTAAERSF